MSSYASLSSQISGIQSEITASLAASTYSAQDLVYVAKAVETLGTMLGVNDIVAATADAQTTLATYVAGVLAGTQASVISKLYIGSGAIDFETAAYLQYPLAVAQINANNFAQLAITNTSSATSASVDFIGYADNGTNDTGYIDMGITSSNYNDPYYTITGKNDGYIFMSAPATFTATVATRALTSNVATITTTAAHNFRVGMPLTITGVSPAQFNGTFTVATIPNTTSFTYALTSTNVVSGSSSGTAVAGITGKGNLVLATDSTGTQNRIVFAAGGLQSNHTQMTIIPDSTVNIAISTASTSTTTGALTVNGGVGIVGNLNVGGSVNITGTITFSGGGTTVSTQNLAVTDPQIFVASTNTGNIVDLSFLGTYVVGATTYYTGLSKHNTDGVWNLVSGLTTKPTTTLNYSDAGLTYDSIKVGQVLLQTAPTQTTHATTKAYVDAATYNAAVTSFMGVY